jgi:hypothetical protein
MSLFLSFIQEPLANVLKSFLSMLSARAIESVEADNSITSNCPLLPIKKIGSTHSLNLCDGVMFLGGVGFHVSEELEVRSV